MQVETQRRVGCKGSPNSVATEHLSTQRLVETYPKVGVGLDEHFATHERFA